ncbi:unnamed protein product [Gongylonema pulchrum]|uniref:Kinesin motor domain-containing protein n=1 Tax=Gongylonema pulchrum TaxID=637853 RepID=A0A183DVW5_9BILA|nr:unnamed protein product [Gongylonema pulchrum]
MREEINANEGLLVLSAVISAPADKSKEHVSCRDGKITRILNDSLGGSSYVVMVVYVSLAHTNTYETATTLRFESQVKQVENKPVLRF